MKNYLLTLAGGGLGASARYWLSGTVYRFLPSDFPYGNLVVNICGSFFIGFSLTSLDEHLAAEPGLRIFLTIGLLGGFTTFSSFSYETFALLRDGQILLASINVIGSVFGCLTATFLGALLGKAF